MDQYVAASWQVKPGLEDDFKRRWRAFTSWTLENAPGARSFTLLHNEAEPDRFISYGTWTDRESIHAWWELEGFDMRYQSCLAVCVDHKGAEHSVAAQLTPVS